MLEWARRQGDALFVGVNSDASVKRVKGAGRPVIGEQDRARTVAALTCVDAVAVFDEPDPRVLMELVKPAVLVKGADNAGTRPPGADLVEEVLFAPMYPPTAPFHTTELLRARPAREVEVND
jgi:rfaE bifunctional protein nucleotidyltransferase chain/domain